MVEPELRLDRQLFDRERIDPEIAQFNSALEELLARQPSLHELSEGERRDRRQRGSVLAERFESALAADRAIEGPGGSLPLRTFTPETVRGVHLHLHGGGWVLGSARLQDRALEALATSCELAVVSVEYRLAPEHPYPAAADDCEAAALWLAERSGEELGTGQLTIGGESAGAQLAVVTLLRMRDRHGFAGFRAASLECGFFDLHLTPSARAWGERNLGLTTAELEWLVDQFVPHGRRHEPDVSPLHADLRGLPAALFTVGTLDPLLDDTLFLASRWAAAGNEAELAVYPGGVHSLTSFPTALARRANARIHAFLAARLEP